MARWIGPIVGLAIALVIGESSIAATDDDGTPAPRALAAPSPPTDGSGAEVSPRYPAGFGSNEEHVDRAAYQSPLEHHAAGGARKTADLRPPTSDLHSPLGGASSAAGDPATRGGRREMPPTPSTGPALLSMLGSLAIVLALFFGLVWLLCRGMPKGTRLVPSEVVEVLGRAALAGRQQMHVVRFGNKLLLIAVTPTGAETLSEITESVEVDRLAGICQQSHAHSATSAFRQVFRQFADDRSPFRRGSARRTIGEPVGRPSTAMEDDDV